MRCSSRICSPRRSGRHSMRRSRAGSSGALDTLPGAQRQAVTLLKVKGLSVAEAAQEAGVSPGALKLRAHRGYKALRDLLGREPE